MRIALISDIHGNFVALETVLADIAREAPDQIVCLGDVAADGPQPRQVLARLHALACPVVQGNTDEWLLNPQLHDVADDFWRIINDIEMWGVAQLSAEDRAFLQTFQRTVEIPLGAGKALLCYHGSPGSNEDQILATTPDEKLESMVSGYGATVLAGGHTHVPMLRRYRDKLLVNPGSVGMLFIRQGETTYNPPWSEYALIDHSNDHLHIELRQVPLDVEAVRQAALNSDMPHAQWWAQDWKRL